MASTEEKLFTLLLSAEHLKEAAKEQQKAVADSLAVARDTLKGYREISDSVAQQVRDEVRQEVQKLDVSGLIGERISTDFQRLEKSVDNMKVNADALDREISIIRNNIVAEYNTLRGYSWKWMIGVFLFAVAVIFSSVAYVKIELEHANNVAANNYHQIKILQEKNDLQAQESERKQASYAIKKTGYYKHLRNLSTIWRHPQTQTRKCLHPCSNALVLPRSFARYARS